MRTFSGTVTDSTQNPAGMTITFGGVLAGQSTTVDSDGSFTYSTEIPANTSGTVTAQTVDNHGTTSILAMDYVSTGGNGYGGTAHNRSGDGGFWYTATPAPAAHHRSLVFAKIQGLICPTRKRA